MTGTGAFMVEQRLNGRGNWTRIWQSNDGADCAQYLETCERNKAMINSSHEYRLRFDVAADRAKNNAAEYAVEGK
jgi:hypothetical protein